MPVMLVVLNSAQDLDAVQTAGISVLARYPHSCLVSATAEQVDTLARAGVETTALPQQPVRVTGNSFDFDAAVVAEVQVPTRQEPNRTGYFLLKLIGPPAAGWLTWLAGNGVEIIDSLDGYTVLIGCLPEALAGLAAQPWVSEVTPYRAAMRISPEVRGGGRRTLGAAFLAEPAVDQAPAPQRVEIVLFPGEDIQPVAQTIAALQGVVLSAVAGGPMPSLAAILPGEAITIVAHSPGVRSIEPHTVAVFHNSQARVVMRVPQGNVFGASTLDGSGQIVAVADSGLDTGDPATLHPDLRGRVAGITSWPVAGSHKLYLTDPTDHDDGPADAQSGHGTHVTGSVLGNASAAHSLGSEHVPAGVAPAAKVFFQAVGQTVTFKTLAQLQAQGLVAFQQPWPPDPVTLYGIPDDLSRLFQQAFDAGARIHTNSWGNDAARGAYTTRAQAVDWFAWEHPQMLILFSAGNEGSDGNGDGVIDPDTISAPATAKNCLSVGASENVRPHGSLPKPGNDAMWNALRNNQGVLKWPTLGHAGHVSDEPDGMAAFSSRGPVDDQRIKPDVVAPGTNVLSVLSSVIAPEKIKLWGPLRPDDPLRPFYCWSGGTSMATPLVAGAAAVIRQYLMEVRGHQPSAALLKAILVNGATPMAGQFDGEVPAGPNNVSGFGRINLERSMAATSGDQVIFDDSPENAVSTGEGRIFEINGVHQGEPLRVTLVWTDAPSGTGGGLFNQLYLRLAAGTDPIVGGDVSAFPDPVNNVQQITIPSPGPGPHRIIVYGYSVFVRAIDSPAGTAPRQTFALAVSNGQSLTRLQ